MSSGSKEINLIFFLMESKFISSVLLSLLMRNLKNICSLYLIFTAFITYNCKFIFFRTYSYLEMDFVTQREGS